MTSDSTKTDCFHCGLPIPDGFKADVIIDGKARPMCCYGCQAVAQSIVDSGMSNFYGFRTEKPAKAESIIPEFLSQLKTYDNPIVQQQFTNDDGDIKQISLILEGIVCAACVWLNEKTLKSLDGVIDVNINYSTHRASVRWDSNRIKLSEILESISRIGYMAHPYDPDKHQAILEKERKAHLRRLGISAIFGMQIMILAVAMYTGEWWGMDQEFTVLFRWSSLILCIPILLFGSELFFRNAWRDLLNRRVGMDVPVSLGIGIAFSASIYHTIIDQGAVYFDSVSMFTFFLLIARYFEMGARKRSSEHTESLLNLTPAVATKIVGDEQIIVPVAELNVGDLILVKPGENIASDGVVTRGTSGINESLVTGESLPVIKSVGNEVIGGSTNTENALVIEVTKIGDDTVLASIHRLLEAAQRSKPNIARLADIFAARFVVIILMIATAVASYWFLQGSPKWLEFTVATLVVTCPCALSLATPTALTAASGQLAKLGLLPLHDKALETLAKATDFVFDKTGTLTMGDYTLVEIEAQGDYSEEECLQVAATLESESEHPLAAAIQSKVNTRNLIATDRINRPGSGITAQIDGVSWCIGTADHIKGECGVSEPIETDTSDANRTRIYLATQNKLVAILYFEDRLRERAKTLIDMLHASNRETHLLTGDRLPIAESIRELTGIHHVRANATPDKKLQYVTSLQAAEKKVVMTGDGINDAPVLAISDVSIAMGSGSQLAATAADIVLISNQIDNIYSGYRLSIKTLSVIRQNLSWALLYNLMAIPAAATGHVPPWLAAIGMSASSLIVVLNALRINK